MKNYNLFLVFALVIVNISCKEELPEDHINVHNKILLKSELLSVGGNAANVSMELENYNNKLYTEVGFCWKSEENPTIKDHVFQAEVVGDTMVTLLIENLKPSTKYYVRGYVVNEGEAIYSNQLEVKTNDGLPVVATADIIALGSSEAKGGGEVLNDGDFDITARGVCWSLLEEPTIDDSITIDSSGLGKYVSMLTNLEMDTVYYVRAYATNSVGTNYGSVKSFRTLKYSSITTASVTNITSLSATSGGDIADDGDFEILSRGVCWGTAPNPTIEDDTTNNGTGKGPFISQLTNLTFSTTYYVRAYLTNREETIYGEEKTFTTLDGLPEITTSDTSNVTDSSVTCGGTVVSDGGYEIIRKGVCWNTTGSPDIYDDTTANASSLQSFSHMISGLSEETTYYVSAYATNVAGTTYGAVKVFTTKQSAAGTLTDIDGNTYKWIRIGDQVWMAENLKAERDYDGNSIPFIENRTQWDTLGNYPETFEGYCYPDYSESNKDLYGVLYSYNVAVKVCPSGWHLPSDDEWATLKSYATNNGYPGEEGIALKSIDGWDANASTQGADAFDFNAVPGGYIYWDDAAYMFSGKRGPMWSSSEHSATEGSHTYMFYDQAWLKTAQTINKSGGFPVRCVKD